MNTIGAIAPGQAEYYFGYANGPDANFRLLGAGVESLRIIQSDGKTAFTRLYDGYHPQTNVALVQSAGRENHSPGIDMVLSAPKDVSILFAFAEEWQRLEIIKAQQAAVEASLSLLQQHARSRVGKGGKELVAAQLLAAAFDHFTNRNNDPQLHTHLVIFNLGVRPNGSTGTILTKPFFELRQAADAIYLETLASELRTRLGVIIEPREHGFAIPGTPPELREDMSSRRTEILDAMAQRGTQGPVAAATAALATRQAKQSISLTQLKESWNHRAAELGWTPEQLRESWGLRAKSTLGRREDSESPRPLTPQSTSPQPKEIPLAVVQSDASIDDLTPKRRGHNRRQKLPAAERNGIGAPRPHDRQSLGRVKRMAERVLHWTDAIAVRLAVRGTARKYTHFGTYNVKRYAASKLAFRLYGIGRLNAALEVHIASIKSIQKVGTVFGEAVYASKKTLRLEEKLKALLRRGAKSKWHACNPLSVGGVLGRQQHLTEQEKIAVRGVTQKPGWVAMLDANDSTRRHEVLQAASQVWKWSGYAATTAIAINERDARNLEAATGIPTLSLQKAQREYKKGNFRLHPFSVAVVDRAEHFTPKDLLWLAKLARRGRAKLVLSGNQRGILAWHKGETFERLATCAPIAKLDEIAATAPDWHRHATRALRNGDSRKALRHFQGQEKLKVEATADLAVRSIVHDWAEKKPEERKHCAILCSSRKEQKLLTEAVQDELRQRGQLAKGKIKVKEWEFSKGDRVRFQQTSRDLRIAGGDTGTVIATFGMLRHVVVWLDSRELRIVPVSRYTNLEPAYAVTARQAVDLGIHSSLVYCGWPMSREKALLQATKAAENTVLYTFDDVRKSLCRRMERSERTQPKTTASPQSQRRTKLRQEIQP